MAKALFRRVVGRRFGILAADMDVVGCVVASWIGHLDVEDSGRLVLLNIVETWENASLPETAQRAWVRSCS